ncbi:polysaccharide biosynthesis/export family protein [Mucilaginibacter sp. Bleaf8]|uniref:polysaccharide biosynthesis/export family protein n=1 Tax=Mucilaginibacter sp. Bleaf8 TaxID=2834430 RepID=UPI001BCA979F|nr:polysaccharide biosynthesis/export family protein [Mucilaginibacter sp. Bleaf8]MBS7566449.1 polysaccharide biosynthesis/export family protein [Mucilaginibacter sp. Bleaf8]
MKSYHNFLNLVLIGFICFACSCVSEKKMTYFQKGQNQSDTVSVAQAYISKIQAGDIVSVYVNSLSTAASTFFNPYSPGASPTDAGASNGTTATPALTEVTSPGFLVDQSGSIEIPLVGQLKIAGLTTLEARDLIRKSLTKYLKEPTVNVRVLNYKISIIGEVAKPSVYVIPNESVSLPEVLSMAGDVTLYANREDVVIVRDLNGKKVFGHVDLTSRDVYMSPFYYLHSNDLVYVKPVKSKATQTSLTYRVLPLAVSVLSVLIVLFSRLN